MKPLKSRDVLSDLTIVKASEAEVSAARDGYASAASSRIGHLVTALTHLSRALGNKADGASGNGRKHAIDFGEYDGTLWRQELRGALQQQQQRLQADVRALDREIEEMRAVNRSLLTEREHERSRNEALAASHAGCRFELDVQAMKLGEALATIDDYRREHFAFATKFDEALALIEMLETVRERDRATLAEARAELDGARASSLTIARALEHLRLKVDREQSIARDARSAARFVSENVAHGALRTPGTLFDKVARLRKSLESHASKLDAASPDVSVIVPAYRNAEMTIDCLQSVCDHLAEPPTIQLIVVDDASPNDTICAFATDLPFITFLRNGSNAGFLRSCNRAAGIATGRYVHLLNNDTIVTAGWLLELIRCADGDETIGAVGSKLINADGSLQEAGGIIWNDATGYNYGRGDDAEDPRYNYVRDVDYCSGASLLVRTDLFLQLGMFDERFAPAYYEDADLCFAIRERGRRVVYAPKSKVIHLEGVSSGTSLESGVKRHQLLNMPKFAAKWKTALSKCFPPTVPVIRAARRLQAPRTAVFIESYVPESDKDAGSVRLVHIMKLIAELGYSVILVPQNCVRTEPYTSQLQDLGIEVLYDTEGSVLVDSLCERLAFADVVWVCRPDVAEQFMPVIREFPGLPIIYDTIDLHYVRFRRELEHKGIDDPDKWAAWERERDLELDAIRSADVSITVSEIERETLGKQGIDNVFIIPTVHDVHERVTAFEKTDGIMFIGGYSHTPNVDAAVWLCEDIMPLVWASDPDIVLTIVGSNPPRAVLDLATDNVRVLGYVPQVEPYFEKTRVFVAPLRYGAGLKGKIGHAFSFGVPVVTTPIGAEGFDIVSGRDALVATNASDLAAAIVRVYTEKETWTRLSENGSALIDRFSSKATGERLKTVLDVALSARKHVDRFDHGKVDLPR